MKRTIHSCIFILLAFLASSSLSASHFRYGDISWRIDNTDPTGRTVEFRVNTGWRCCPYVGLNYGGQVPQTLTGTANGAEYYTGTKTYTFPSNGTYRVYYSGGAKIGNLQNNANGSWYVYTDVNIGTGNNSPVTSLPAIVNVQNNLSQAKFTVPAADPDGDNLTFRLASSADGWPGTQPSGISINSSTGEITWNTVGKSIGQLWNAAVIISDGNGSEILVDFIMQITQQSNPPQFDYSVTPANGFAYQAAPGQTISFNVEAFDNDPGSTVSMFAAGMPTGATVSPAFGATANPINHAFSWTPTSSQFGQYVINFTAQDNNGVQVSTSVSINVSLKPVFDVPPTPVAGAHNTVVSPGTLISYTVQASDPDPADVVRIIAIEGKNMMGNKIPIYAGATLTPLPTVAGNPTSGTFNWTPTQAQWGHRHVYFTAEDSYGDQTVHEVSQLVNTPPNFTSSPVLTADVGQPYSYTIQVNDPDLPYGDMLSIFGITLPTWLSVVDNGNGTATLSGTPGLSDAGANNITIQAEDMHHHHDPRGIIQQLFTITVNSCTVTAATQNVTVFLDANGQGTILNQAAGLNPIFTEDFLADANQTTTNPITNWNVLGAGIDVGNWIGGIPGNEVDLSAFANGGIESINSFNLAPGNYQLSFQHIRNTTDDPFTVTIGSLVNQTFNSTAALQSETISFTVNTATSAKISFIQGGTSDANGTFVGNIVLSEDAPASYAIDNGSSASCGIASISVSQANFACADVGSNTVTLYVTDINGNVDSSTATVTVQDTVSPVAVANSINVYLDASGNASITAGDIDGGSSDACGIASSSIDNSSFGCSDVGSQSVTLTVTDNNGNSSSSSANITVIDSVSPSAVAQNINVYLDANGNASINAGDVDGGSSDACGISLTVIDSGDFDCSTVGMNPVNLTVTDNNGNSSTSSAIVTVLDTVSPVAIAQDITVYLDASGNASVTAGDIDAGSNDACGIASTGINISTLNCSNVGTNPVTLFVTDNNGNASTANATITVVDTVAPSLSCPTNITVNTDAGECGATVDFTAAVMAYNPTGQQTNVSSVPVSSSAAGFTGNNLTSNGYSVQNNTGVLPVGPITTSTSIDLNQFVAFTVNIPSGQYVSQVSYDKQSYLGNGATKAAIRSSLDGFATDLDNVNTNPSGTERIFFDVSSIAGANGSIEFRVYFYAANGVDWMDLMSSDRGGQGLVVYVENILGLSDNCDFQSINFTGLNSNDFYPVGTTTISALVTDMSGNTASCSFDITVNDNEAPAVNTQNITVYLDANGDASISSADVDNGSSDACGIASISISDSIFNCSTVGANTISLSVTDNNGNTASAPATVTVVDSTAPVAIANGMVLFLDASGNGTITASDIDGGSNDACGIASISVDDTTFGCADVGPNMVTLTVTDNNGNSSSAATMITVVDSVKPTVIVQNIDVYLDENGNATITAADVDGGSNDACGIEAIGISDSIFNCSNVGLNTITLEVRDNNRNKASAQVVVNVIDSLPPEVITQDITVYLDANGNASITPSDIDNGSNDECGIASMVVNPNTFDCSDVLGDNSITIVTDSTWFMSKEVDSLTCLTFPWVGPAFVPGSASFRLPVTIGQPYGYVSINPIPGSQVIRANRHVTFYRKTFDLTSMDQLATRIRMSVDDDLEIFINGHLIAGEYAFAQSSFQGVPHDLFIDVNGTVTNGYNGGDTYGYVSNTALDSIFVLGTNEIIVAVRNRTGQDRGGLTMVMDVFADFDGNAVTLSVTDNNGNTASGSATVTVVDSIAPTITQVPASFTAYTLIDDCTPPVFWTLPLAEDACVVQSLVGTHHPGDHFPVGTTTVTYTATDMFGNSSSASFDITVVDTTAPTVVCNSFDLYLDASGNASITDMDVDGGSTDACGIASTSIDLSSFGCGDIGVNTVNLTVTDIYGNSSSCAASINVIDTIAPVAVCQSITIALDNTGLAEIVPSMIDGGSNDACGIASISASQTGFTCSNVGANTVTLTVTDNNGNVSSCNATVTVIDTIAPMVMTQNITIALDDVGEANISTDDIDNGSADACGIASISLDKTSFDCSNLGANTVTLTVTDNNGNVASATATVTVNEDFFVTLSSMPDIDKSCKTNIGGRYVHWDAPTAGTFTSCSGDTCPAGENIPGFIYLGTHNGHRYFCSDNSNYTWNQANAAAQAAGGHLAVINDAAENHFLACRVQAIYSWIGLNDANTEGQFEWVNGDPVNYTKWSYYEPNNTGGYYCGWGSYGQGADHTVLRRWSGKWYDRRECNKHEFIMEVPCGNDVVISQVAGPAPGSLFPQGTTTVTYLAQDTVTGATDTTSFNVTIGDCTPTYCSAQGNNSSHEWIQKVKMGNVSNNSGNDGGYGDYTNLVVNTKKGKKVKFTLSPGFSDCKYKEYWRIFVDWNNDGDFYDYKECVYQGKSKNKLSGKFKVPHWAAAGNLRVRVVMKWGGYAGPCSHFPYGEVEDYTLVVTNASGGGISTKNGNDIAGDNTDDGLSINQELTNLYPNPILSGQNMTLDIRSAKEETIELTIRSTTGQLISTQSAYLREGVNSIEIKPGNLSTGTYFIQLSNSDEAIPFIVKF